MPTKSIRLGLCDAAAWPLAALAVVWLRQDFQPTATEMLIAAGVGTCAGILQYLLGIVLGTYRGRYRTATFDELASVSFTVSCVAVGVSVVLLLLQPSPAPRSVGILAGALALVLMLAGRSIWRFRRDRLGRSRDGEPTLIYGAGETGAQLVTQMLRDGGKRYLPVGFLDDDPTKRNLRIAGVSVRGTGRDLESVALETAAKNLVVARTAVSSDVLRDLDCRCESLRIHLSLVPSIEQVVNGQVHLADVADVTDEDLLGRHPVDVDEASISRLLSGKRILVTGAGGSIGSELARQVHKYEPSALGLLDRDESALQAVQLSIDGSGLLSDPNIILADIRDTSRMAQVFKEFRPEIVFHAAALKHLSLLELHPEEAWKTNVLGTQTLLEVARLSDVEIFVNVSTDKAADPTSILGRSKLMTERLTAATGGSLSERHRYVSVRFGNVLGSRGSVLHTFRIQIARGGPVTVTHPDVTRFLMTVGEAVHLLLQACTLGNSGETLILNMGKPVKILDVAQHLIRRSGKQVDVQFTGLRPGEKLHESLTSPSEEVIGGRHPQISVTRVSPSSSPEDWLLPTTTVKQPSED